jgi:hypothetical protein
MWVWFSLYSITAGKVIQLGVAAIIKESKDRKEEIKKRN